MNQGPVEIIIPSGSSLPEGAGLASVIAGTTCGSLAEALTWIAAHQPYTHAAHLRLSNGRTLNVAEAKALI